MNLLYFGGVQMKRIKSNKAKCRQCRDIIESKSRTKVVKCSCGAIFIEGGKITEVLQLELTAKVPDGMLSEELARPVIVVSSFIQKKPLYEIYTFGEQVVVMPIAYEAD